MKIYTLDNKKIQIFTDQLKFFRFGANLINISTITNVKRLSVNPTEVEVSLVNGQIITVSGNAADDLEGVLADYTIYESKGN